MEEITFISEEMVEQVCVDIFQPLPYSTIDLRTEELYLEAKRLIPRSNTMRIACLAIGTKDKALAEKARYTLTTEFATREGNNCTVCNTMLAGDICFDCNTIAHRLEVDLILTTC